MSRSGQGLAHGDSRICEPALMFRNKQGGLRSWGFREKTGNDYLSFEKNGNLREREELELSDLSIETKKHHNLSSLELSSNG